MLPERWRPALRQTSTCAWTFSGSVQFSARRHQLVRKFRPMGFYDEAHLFGDVDGLGRQQILVDALKVVRVEINGIIGFDGQAHFATAPASVAPQPGPSCPLVALLCGGMADVGQRVLRLCRCGVAVGRHRVWDCGNQSVTSTNDRGERSSVIIVEAAVRRGSSWPK